MVLYNKKLIGSLFNNSKTTIQSASNESNVTYITGIALADSVDGEVLVEIGDPIEVILDEDDLEVTIEVDPDDTDDTVANADEEALAEEPGEDDEILEEEDEEIFYGSGGDGDDDETDEDIPDDVDFEGNVI